MNLEDMFERLAGRLSLRRRIATVAAMLGGLAVAIVVGLLWVTEPNLPARTQVAFGAIVALGLAWVGFGVWVLNRRLPLFALDRVVAAWMGLAAWPTGGAGGPCHDLAAPNGSRRARHRRGAVGIGNRQPDPGPRPPGSARATTA
jgi:hypothetical protein